MKTLLRTSAVLICFFALTFSCTKENVNTDYKAKASEYIKSLQTRSAIEDPRSIVESVKMKDITAKDIPTVLTKSLKESSIKDLTKYSIRTISEGGVPVLHSVNFDKGGWALVASRDLMENTILAYGEEGSFNHKEIENPEVAFWFKITKESLKAYYKQADEEYEQKSKSLESIRSEKEARDLESFSFEDPYVWVRLDLGTEQSTQTTILDHLTETKWGRGFPWNYKCPTINGIQRELGPGAVAVSQLLYYLHFNLGKPTGCFHDIDTSYIWHNNGSYYTTSLTRSNYISPSDRWNDMATTNPNINCLNTQYVGNLMIDIADRMNTRFYTNFSFDYFASTVLSYYNIASSAVSYNLSETLYQLDNALPVLIHAIDTASSYDNNREHMWLIDGYKKIETLSDHKYKWVTMPPDSLSYYSNINYDYVFTESEMQQFYPNVVENEIIHVPAIESYNVLLLMNWGFDGYNNNNYYSYQPISWYVNNNHYNMVSYIRYGFH